MNGIQRFFGGSPGWVIVRLALISLVVGFVFSAFGIHPLDIVYNMERLFHRLWSMGFAAVGDALGYLILGALVVVPVWLVMRILKMGRGGPP